MSTIDADRSPVDCPFCDSQDVELVSAWGGQLITSQLRCRHCNTYFEGLRDDFEAAPSGSGGPSVTPEPPHLTSS